MTIVDDGIYQNLVLKNAMSDNPMAAASFFLSKSSLRPHCLSQ